VRPSPSPRPRRRRAISAVRCASSARRAPLTACRTREAGPILIYINPYKSLPIFNPELVQLYAAHNPDIDPPLPPHNYEVANRAYHQMRKENSAQSMVVSGESGAGKTEATKICLNFMAEVAGSKGDDSPTQLLLDSSPIMESFGNAKTIRNNNSSRFGKYMEIHFQDQGARSMITGGVIKKWVLFPNAAPSIFYTAALHGSLAHGGLLWWQVPAREVAHRVAGRR
jgi:hypothetical protein